jgi:hypothetical protein
VGSPNSALPPPLQAGPNSAIVVPPRVTEEQNIRRVLQRYALAYKQLDANAAKAVWPTVDQRALSRAFNGLESQDLTLTDCDLTIGGAEARAICHGTAIYVPKIGKREARRLVRDWVFTLKRLDSGWAIAHSETR